MEGRGRFFDGASAAEHKVDICLSADRMSLVISGATLTAKERWPLADLRATGDHADEGQIVLTRHFDSEDESPRHTARLIIDSPDMVAWLRRTRPNLHKRDVRAGTGRRIARNAALAVGAVALMLFVILPAMANTLARIIPLEREIAFGKSVTAQIERFLGGSELGALHCEGAEGRAALDEMVARITQGQTLDYDLNILVFDHSMINAFAAPGGQVVLMRGLIDKASGPDVVAAVLAHEIGHVVNRDATRAALRTVGSAGLLSLLIGDVTGGAVIVAVGEQMVNSSYSREAETQADAYALRLLNEAEVSSEGMGDFFDVIAEMQEEGLTLPEYLATHPASDTRAERARDNARTQEATSPVLSADQWAALQSICD